MDRAASPELSREAVDQWKEFDAELRRALGIFGQSRCYSIKCQQVRTLFGDKSLWAGLEDETRQALVSKVRSGLDMAEREKNTRLMSRAAGGSWRSKESQRYLLGSNLSRDASEGLP